MAKPKSEDRLNAILPSAIQVCAERWLGAPTVAITSAAGVAEPTLFTNFRTGMPETHCFRDNALVAGAGVTLIPAMAAASAEGCRVVPLYQENFRRIGYVDVRRQIRLSAQTAFIDSFKRSLLPPR